MILSIKHWAFASAYVTALILSGVMATTGHPEIAKAIVAVIGVLWVLDGYVGLRDVAICIVLFALGCLIGISHYLEIALLLATAAVALVIEYRRRLGRIA